MGSEETLFHVLERGLQAELDAIRFYLDNLEHFNYEENAKAMDELLLDSFDHAKWLVKQLLERRGTASGPIPSLMRQDALEEERGMREIYEYELARTEDAGVKALMEKLIREERKHEKLVRGLK